MKPILLCVAFSLCGSVSALAQPAIPASSWEQHPEGFALAVILTKRIDNERSISSIEVYFKNIGKKDFFTSLPEPIPTPFQVFYLNDSKVLTPLRDYNPNPGPPPTVEASVMPLEIKPGETVSGAIDITPNELALIRGRHVVCKVSISDHENGGYKLIESSPKILVTAP